MRSKVLAVAAVLLVFMLGWAFQWRYDETHLRGRKTLIRTNRWTGEAQWLGDSGWHSTKPSGPVDMVRYTTAMLPPCDLSKKGTTAYDKTVSQLKTCDGAQWTHDDSDPYLAILERHLAE